MFRAASQTRSHQPSHEMVFGAVVIAAVVAVSGQVQAGDSISQNLAQLIQGGRQAGSRAAIKEFAPNDARATYAQALLSLERQRYRDAVEAIDQTIKINPQNLNAWKTRIWLALMNQDYRKTADTMAYLGSRMPEEDAPSNSRIAGDDMAKFLGQVFGYLSGPREGSLTDADMYRYEQLVRLRMTPSQSQAFVAGRKFVTDEFNSRMDVIREMREKGRIREAAHRESQLSGMASEEGLWMRQLGELEELRARDRDGKSNERNTIALTRENSGGGYGYRQIDDSISSFGGNGFYPNGNIRRFFGGFSQNRGRGSGGGGYGISRGLGDRHVWATYQNEKQYDDYLVKRERILRRRMRASKNRQEDIMLQPLMGTSPHLMAQVNKMKALTTYISLPVDPTAEIDRMVETLTA